MQIKLYSSLLTLAACALMTVGAASTTSAADATGKWSWSRPGRQGGDPVKITLTLKQEGTKLTGKVSMPGRQGAAQDTEISDGSVKDGTVAFSTVVERNGNKMTTKYSGKLEGDTIKGKIESERNGQAQSRDWEAKRDK
jgi:hypothetical protein